MARHSRIVAGLAEGYLRAGRTDEALDLAGRALDLSRAQKERSIEAWTLRLLGEIASHRDPPEVEAAERDYLQALAWADELGMRPLSAHCHLGLGKLYRRAAQRREAEEHLATAVRLFREMDMAFYLKPAEAELDEVLRTPAGPRPMDDLS